MDGKIFPYYITPHQQNRNTSDDSAGQTDMLQYGRDDDEGKARDMNPEQLKDSILQRPVEGKPVKQRPGEGNAADPLRAVERNINVYVVALL